MTFSQGAATLPVLVGRMRGGGFRGATPNQQLRMVESSISKELSCAMHQKSRLERMRKEGRDPMNETWTRIGFHTGFRSLPVLPPAEDEEPVECSEFDVAVRAIPLPIAASSTGMLHQYAYRRHRPLMAASFGETSRAPTPAKGGPGGRERLLKEVYGEQATLDMFKMKYTTPPSSAQAHNISKRFRHRKPGGGFFGL